MESSTVNITTELNKLYSKYNSMILCWKILISDNAKSKRRKLSTHLHF